MEDEEIESLRIAIRDRKREIENLEKRLIALGADLED